MKPPKNVFLVILLVLLTAGMFGQRFTVLYTSASSGIEYASEDGPVTRVFAGLTLDASGRLKIEEGRSVNVVYEGKKIRLEGPQQVELAALVRETSAQPSSSFIGRFWSFISSSVTNTGSAEDVEHYYKKYMTNTRAGIKGWGEKENGIAFPFYFSKVLGEEVLPFRWDSIGDVQHYAVSIIDRSTGETFFTALAKNNQLNIPLADLALTPEAMYQLRVTADRGGEIVSSPNIFFSYEPASVNAFLEKLKNKRVYKSLTPDEQQLFVPHALEEAEYLYAARQHYEQLLAESPENQLYRKLYAAFLTRMDAPEEATAILK